MSLGVSTSNGLAADARSLDALKYANSSDPKAVREAAKQFESLFMRELIKSMREASTKSGLLDSDGEKLGTDLLDQQLAVQMSGRPGGLSDAIARQLSQQIQGQQAPSTISLAGLGGIGKARVPATASQSDFVARHQDAAERVAQDSGIPAAFMMGQAGHETGWGRHEIRNADGSSAHNLFGIKATAGWTGKVATVTTTEYINGEARKVKAKFRAYDSYEESFRDYARLIGENPRYEKARASTHSAQAYASHLQKAGYATDPAYARKLGRAIEATMAAQHRLQST